MTKFAVVKIGSSQLKISEGEEISVNKIEGEKGKSLIFEEVLLLVDDKKILIGQPLIKGVKVKAKIVDQVKGEKVRIATFKAKTRYRRVKGFRSLLTKLKIEKILRGNS